VTGNSTRGNGFVFSDYTSEALLEAVRRAIESYQAKRGWKAIVQRAMSSDMSWKASARQYADLYATTREGLSAPS